MQVHDSNDEDAVSVDPKDNPEWKRFSQTTAGFAVDNGIEQRGDSDPV